MSNKDEGNAAENYVTTILEQKGFNVTNIDSYYDLLVNDTKLEVKSTNLKVSRGQHHLHSFGWYHFTSKANYEALKTENAWVVFVINLKTGPIIQGFIKANQIPKKSISIPCVECLKPLSLQEFVLELRNDLNGHSVKEV